MQQHNSATLTNADLVREQTMQARRLGKDCRSEPFAPGGLLLVRQSDSLIQASAILRAGLGVLKLICCSTRLLGTSVPAGK